MSSDESNIEQNSIKHSNRKPNKSEQWEIDLIGNFLLSLHHRLVISPQNDWTCEKAAIQKDLQRVVTTKLRKHFEDGPEYIDNLLQRCGFLFNNQKGSRFYTFKSGALLKFRNKILAEKDKQRINDDENYEIDEDSEVYPVDYIYTIEKKRRANYQSTLMSCFICQLNFTKREDYGDHIETLHGNGLSGCDGAYCRQIFSVSCRLCKDPDYLCFTVQNEAETTLVMENIIIVQGSSMFYFHTKRVPYDIPVNGCENFYVNSRLFGIWEDQSIIFISHVKERKDFRILEEHEFTRISESPKKNLSKPGSIRSDIKFTTIVKVKEYFPPAGIRHLLKDDFNYEALTMTSQAFQNYIENGKVLDKQTIARILTTLLEMEDMHTINEYTKLFQRQVRLSGLVDDNYSMQLNSKQRADVENIVSNCDEVIITRSTISTESQCLSLILTSKEDLKDADIYVGQIEDIYSGKVRFKCFSKIDLSYSYTIVFRPSRLQIRYQYRAMELLPDMMSYLQKFLFPDYLAQRNPSMLSLNLFNEAIYTNPEQLQAVRNIAEGPRNDATYIIFGPPGTGKTATVVESILQVLKRSGTKIVVTATSNSACDEVALRLCKALRDASLNSSSVIARIYSKSCESRRDNIDDLLLENSNIFGGHFYPAVDVLHAFRVIVCTTAVLAKLSTGDFGRSRRYTHLFIDEVAASTEVDALTAITSIITSESCLIISGDYKQLGPIVNCKRAEEFNLTVSLMDRLMERECYRVDDNTGYYDKSIQSRLRQNFRSHPEIVKLYSRLYYNNDLKPKANIDDVSLVKHWHMAPSQDYPIIFHSINGKSCSEKNSTSLYNLDEVDCVMDYVKDLMYFGINGKPVKECDIGIISPYKKQFQRIRDELNVRKWYHIETGSVETFQGKEKDIIIVSFVRSRTPTIGFLDSPRRLNVTLSRAKSLLILIGNPKTLSMSDEYAEIIGECQRHNTLIGSGKRGRNQYKTSNDDVDDTMDMINQSLKGLKLNNDNEKNNRRRGRGGRRGKGNNKRDDNIHNNGSSTSNAAKSYQRQNTKKENQKDEMWPQRITKNIDKSSGTLTKRNSSLAVSSTRPTTKINMNGTLTGTRNSYAPTTQSSSGSLNRPTVSSNPRPAATIPYRNSSNIGTSCSTTGTLGRSSRINLYASSSQNRSAAASNIYQTSSGTSTTSVTNSYRTSILLSSTTRSSTPLTSTTRTSIPLSSITRTSTPLSSTTRTSIPLSSTTRTSTPLSSTTRTSKPLSSTTRTQSTYSYQSPTYSYQSPTYSYQSPTYSYQSPTVPVEKKNWRCVIA